MKLVPRFLREDKNLIFELSRRNIKQQYRGSILGFLWTVLNPLLTMLVLWLVFNQMFGKDDPFYPIYLLCGNIMFTSLRTATTMSLASIENNRSLLLRTKVNPYVFSCSISLSSIVNFFLSLIALIPFMIWLSITQGVNLFSYRLVYILLMLPAFWLFEYGASLFLSVLYIFFKDLKHLYNVFLLAWQYLTPIFYKISSFESHSAIRILVKLNPMYHFVTYFRECIYMGAANVNPETFEIMSAGEAAINYLPSFATLGIIYGCGIVCTGIAVIFYKLLKRKVIVNL